MTVGRDYSLFNETGISTKTIWQTIKNLPDSSSSFFIHFHPILPCLSSTQLLSFSFPFLSSYPLLSFSCPCLHSYRLLSPPFPVFILILYFLLLSFSSFPSSTFLILSLSSFLTFTFLLISLSFFLSCFFLLLVYFYFLFPIFLFN